MSCLIRCPWSPAATIFIFTLFFSVIFVMHLSMFFGEYRLIYKFSHDDDDEAPGAPRPNFWVGQIFPSTPSPLPSS